MVDSTTKPIARDGDDNARHGAFVRTIAARLGALSIDELRVVDVITTRMLTLGRKYGKLDLSRDDRDFRKEQADEYADSLFYGACDAIAATDRRLERLACEVADEQVRPIEAGLAELVEATEGADGCTR